MPEIDGQVAAQIVREVQRIGTDTKAAFDGLERQLAELRRADAELKTYADTLADRVGRDTGSPLRAELDRVHTEIARVEAALSRAGTGQAEDGKTMADFNSRECKAFRQYLRMGENNVGADERKALLVGEDPRGGFLAPPQFQAEVLRNIIEFDPIRALSRGFTTGSDKLDIPFLASGPTAYWVGEVETRTETDATFANETLELGELACYIDCSLRILEDSAVNIETLLAVLLGEAFAAAEGKAFLVGDGIKKPFGVLSNPSLPRMTSGNATTITGDSLIDATAFLKASYSGAATWVMNRSTFGQLRKIKDTVGNYLFVEGGSALVVGSPGTIVGRPVTIAPDMPNVAAGSLPVLFGDFRRGYGVLDKVGGGGLQILRDPFTQMTNGKIRFHARLRVGGGPLVNEAMVAIQVAA